MKRFLNMLLLACCLSVGYVSAESSDTTENSSSGDSSTSMPDKSSVEAALTACASSASKDSSGYADQSAMDSCMTGKGFSRPSGPPPGDGKKQPPNRSK